MIGKTFWQYQITNRFSIASRIASSFQVSAIVAGIADYLVVPILFTMGLEPSPATFHRHLLSKQLSVERLAFNDKPLRWRNPRRAAIEGLLLEMCFVFPMGGKLNP
jgi:hypothetical protein